MVPLVVAPVARHLSGKAIRAIHKFLILKGYVEDVLSTYLFLSAGTVAYQYAATVAVGLKPEHQRVVLLLGTVHGALHQLQSVAFGIEVKRVTTRDSPVGTQQTGVGSLRLVYGIVAVTLVHRVVIHKAHLIACQTLTAIGVADGCTVHGTIPQPCLHHSSFIVTACRATALVGASEDKIARTAVMCQQLVLTQLLTAVIEPQ